jgi:hypothetical protein
MEECRLVRFALPLGPILMSRPKALFDETIQAIPNTASEENRKTFNHHATVEDLVHELRSISAANALAWLVLGDGASSI